MEIFGRRMERDSKEYITVPVGELAHQAVVQMPVIVVAGKNEGKVLWVNGAVHGDELNGSYGAWELSQELEPALICLNPDLKSRVHEAVLDNKGIGENVMGTAAAIAAYHDCEYYADQMVVYLEKNVELVCRALEKTDKITLIRPEGTDECGDNKGECRDSVVAAYKSIEIKYPIASNGAI